MRHQRRRHDHVSRGVPANASLTDVWFACDRRVYAVLVVDLIRTLVHRAFQSHYARTDSDTESKLPPPSPVGVIIAVLIFTQWPTVLNVILVGAAGKHPYATWFWFIGFGLVNGVMLMAAYSAWSYPRRRERRAAVRS
jgi:general stress protein CsbA